MPGIVLFKRRWSFGSDDLVFPGLIEILFRTAWLIVVLAVYIHHRDGFHCTTEGSFFFVIYQVMIAVLVVHIISSISVVYASSRGTILDTEARRTVAPLLYVKLLLAIPEFAWICVALYWAFGTTAECTIEAVITVKVAILTECGVFVVVAVGIAVLFDPVGELRGEDRDSNMLARKTRKAWEYRMKVIFCCLMCDEHSRMAFKDISESITTFFKGMDVVPTDIAAGLLLLYQCEEKRRLASSIGSDRSAAPAASAASAAPPTPASNAQRPSNAAADSEITLDADAQCDRTCDQSDDTNPADDWTKISFLVHYMRYAMACYGWPLYVMMHLRKGLCRIVGCCRCCRPAERGGIHVDDNCFGGNLTAILKFTRLSRGDVLFASYHNKVYEVPFFVAVDHRLKSVVVAIRGTMSLRDLVTDLTTHSEDLDVDDDGGVPYRGHKGIVQAARYVVTKLEQLKLLTETFATYPDYTLVVTGHSLGGGTAAIVALMLRQQFPHVRCYSYSPPATLSRPTFDRLGEFVCSVIVGDDLVSRLSFRTMAVLRDKVYDQLRRSTKPKYKILASGVWYVLCGLPCAIGRRDDDRSPSASPLLHGRTSVGYSSLSSTAHDESEQCEQELATLYPPGRILHVTWCRDSVEKNDCTTTWREHSHFDQIVVHPMMLLDHLPDVVYRALRTLEKRSAVQPILESEDC